MGSTEPSINYHAFDDDNDDCMHSSNNVTVFVAAKAKVAHTENNPTYRQMQQSPALSAIWRPLFLDWFQMSLASGQVIVVTREKAKEMNVQFIQHLNLTKTKADGTHKVRNAPNGIALLRWYLRIFCVSSVCCHFYSLMNPKLNQATPLSLLLLGS